MKKFALLFAVLGSVFFAGCAKEDTATTQTEVKSEDAAGNDASTEVTTEVTTTTE